MNHKTMVLPKVDTLKLYRMPWTFSDNPFSWMEPTRNCDLNCAYCYQEHDKNSNKSLDQFEKDLKGLLSLRKCDAINIAGGEPLIHPQICEIISMVKSYGVKPIIITNGQSLSAELLKKLKKAGAYGFTFHVDSLQNRPGWTGCDESELNTLRQKFADMVYNEGGLICGFNTTIVPSQLHQTRYIIEWTMKNADRVQTNLIIPVRLAPQEDCWEYFAGNIQIDSAKSVYAAKFSYRPITAMELYREALEVDPHFSFNSYLGGTIIPNAPKWLFANTISSGGMTHGYLGARGMEIIQSGFHFIQKRFVSYLNPKIYNHAKLLIPLVFFDKDIRHAFKKYFLYVLKNPLRLFKRLSFQTIIIMQPQDLMENGEQDQCDGCPNRTYINGQLVSECRSEDYIKYGRLIQIVKKEGALKKIS